MTFYWSHWWPLTLSWCPTYLAENKRLEIKSPPFKIAQIKMLYLLLKFSFFLSFEFKVSISLKISSLNIEVPIELSNKSLTNGRDISGKRHFPPEVLGLSFFEDWKVQSFFRSKILIRSFVVQIGFLLHFLQQNENRFIFFFFAELKFESEVKIEALAEMSFHYLLLLLVLWETIFWLKIYCQTDVRCSRRWKEEE